MAQRPLWLLTLTEKSAMRPNLFRISLSGEALVNFPQGREGDYIKLLLPKSSSIQPRDVDFEKPDLSPFYKRSFTILEFDTQQRSLTFLVEHHEHQNGPAADWVNAVGLGDEVLITGPGPVQQVDAEAKNFLLVADLPGLAGVMANLRRLPENARGHVVLEVPSETNRVDLELPKHMQLHTVVTPQMQAENPRLSAKVRELKWPRGGCFVWAACEYNTMKDLRSYFFAELKLKPADVYLSSYWKLGDSDEQHKQAKRAEFPD